MLLGLKNCKILWILEIAHDIQQQVSKLVVGEGLTNSYHTWHSEDFLNTRLNGYWSGLGTKDVGKQMLKTSSGLVRNRSVLWLLELVDKCKCITQTVLLYGEVHPFNKTQLYLVIKTVGIKSTEVQNPQRIPHIPVSVYHNTCVEICHVSRCCTPLASSPGPSCKRIGPGIHCMRMSWIFVEGVVIHVTAKRVNR